MRRVDWSEYSISTSKLAFGCAPIMGRIGRKDALRAMNLAYSLGVTHFDVARSYGYGEAESVVGEFLKGRHGAVSVATKFGINPSRRSRLLAPLKPIARLVRAHSRAFRSHLRTRAASTLIHGDFSLKSATQSFEESLRRLKAEQVDILFLHDCTPEDQLSEETYKFLEQCVSSGKCRCWGYATNADAAARLVVSPHHRPQVLQVPFSRDNHSHHAFQGFRRILHSPFGGSDSSSALKYLLRDVRVINWCAAMRLDCTPALLSRLRLELALSSSHSDDIVLCSMFSPEHIRNNIEASRMQSDKDMLMAFSDLLVSLGRNESSGQDQ